MVKNTLVLVYNTRCVKKTFKLVFTVINSYLRYQLPVLDHHCVVHTLLHHPVYEMLKLL